VSTELEQILGEKLNAVLQRILDGARGDIYSYSQRIAYDLVQAAQIPTEADREAAVRQLKNQIVMVGELNRIRVNQEMHDLLNSVVDLAFDVGFRALGLPPAADQREG
jgi:hypothetical protein